MSALTCILAMSVALARSFSHAICLSARSLCRRRWASWKTLVASGSSRFVCRPRAVLLPSAAREGMVGEGEAARDDAPQPV
jgi:hypothetical protein